MSRACILCIYITSRSGTACLPFRTDCDSIVYRGCTIQNIFMEGDGMYPEGFHPMWPNITQACDGAAKQRFTRTRKPPRYYLTGFGSASYFPPSERNPLVFASQGGNDDLPEQMAPYDPFPADVYCLGNAIHTFL